MECPELIFVVWRVLRCVAVSVVTIVFNLIWFLSLDDVKEILSYAHVMFLAFAKDAFLINIPLARENTIPHLFVFCCIENIRIDLLFLKQFKVFACEFN
jgi:hypothetical protein